MTQMTGGEAVVRTLQALGVQHVFGIPSVHNLPIVDALGILKEPRFMVVRHEQGAATMADGYARSSGRLGVCLTSTGPGAANSVTALWEAANAGTPVLEITGQIPQDLLGRSKGALHEIRDQPSLLRSVCKYIGHAERVEEIPRVLVEAARQALSGRPGPVAVEIPINVQYDTADVLDIPELVLTRPAPKAADVEEVVKRIANAKRIVIWAGGGAVRSGASAVLTEMAERLGAPVVTSTNGRSAIEETHPLCLGAATTVPKVREYLESADLWLAVGTRFQHEATDDWEIKPPKTIVHINIDPTEKNRNYASDIFMAADVRAALEAILAALPAQGRPREQAVELAVSVWEWRRTWLGPYKGVVEAVESALGANGVLACDSTMAAYSFGNRIVRVHRPGSFVHTTTSAIGPGLPLAMGAKVARPEDPVIAFCGDGGFMLNVGELSTVAQYRIPVVIMLFNDRAYGILKVIQDRRHEGRRFGVDLEAPDFMKLCESFGIRGMRASSVDEVRSCLKEAMADGGPVMLEVDVPSIGPIPLRED